MSRIDFFSVTVRGIDPGVFKRGWLGQFSLNETGHGGQGFKVLEAGHMGVRLLHSPVSEGEKYFHFSIPGEACKLLWSQGWFDQIKGLIEVDLRPTRVDVCVDTYAFTPFDAWLKRDDCMTFAKRSTHQWITSPGQMREDGVKGADTMYLGSPSSSRRLRIYNLHGYTRVEVTLRERWAKEFWKDYKERGRECLEGHIFGFVDWPDWEEWREVIGSDLPLYDPLPASTVEFEKSKEWVAGQIAPTLEFLRRYMGDEPFLKFVRNEGGGRVSQKHLAILEEKGRLERGAVVAAVADG